MLTKIKNFFKKIWEGIKRFSKRFWRWLVTLFIGTAIAAPLALAPANEISLTKLQDKLTNAPQEIQAKYALEDAALKLTKIKNAQLTKRGEVKDKIEVKIGDKEEFKPKLSLRRWDEVGFDIELIENESGKPSLDFVEDKIKWSKGNIDIEYYSYDEDEGGYKMVWYLKEKPASNIVEFDLNTEGLDFFYQPPLDEEMRNDECWTEECTPTDCCDAHRPENVVGSYAVYHSTKGGMNYVNGKDYKVGKAFHIYRPHLIDAEGKEAWGILNIGNGIYSVEIPQDFLDKAVYPIKSNDTFGDEGIGKSIFSICTYAGSRRIVGTRFTLSSSGTADSVSAYLQSQNEDFIIRMGIYQDSDDTLTDSSTANTVGAIATEWFDRDMDSGASLSAQDYFLVVRGGDNSQVNIIYSYYDSTGSATYYKASSSNSNLPSPFDGTIDESGDKIYSIYATYTLAAEAEQEGFAFGDDDNNEASHTLDTQDTAITEELGTKTLRVILDSTDDYDSSAFKLKYQKNGSGGYADVPVGSTSTSGVTIESGDVTQSGDNSTTQTFDMSVPAYSSGDLVILNISVWQDNNDTQGVSFPAGPNSESITAIDDDYGGSGNADMPILAIGYYIATDDYAGGTLTITADDAIARWDSGCIVVPTGEFDVTTPISANDTQDNSGTDNVSDIDMPTFNAGAADGGGKLVVVGGSDQDAWSNTPPAGYTEILEHDEGREAIGIWVRDDAVTNSESIDAATFDLSGTNSDALAIYGYIVRPAAGGDNEIYVSTSGNVAAGGEDTTARLTAPSGKTGDFTTGRRWDDENGDDSIDIAEDYYTELEWILTTQSPADVDDYYEFRVYNGDDALDTYTLTPKWTISSGEEEETPTRNRLIIIQ